MFLSIMIWFIIDTGFSAYHKVYTNVFLNTFIFIMDVIPLIFLKNTLDKVEQNP
jgi:hypothetical protein